MGEPIHYKLLSFSENDSVRRFIFKKAGDPKGPSFTVTADVELARKWNVPLQDLPLLCARVLEAGADDRSSQTLEISVSDLTVTAATNAATKQELADKRSRRGQRGKTPEQAEQEQCSAN